MFDQKASARIVRILVVMALSVGIFAPARLLAAPAAAAESYPAPRYPTFISNPTKEQMLAVARYTVRQTYGFCPLGKVTQGETVYIILETPQDMSVFEAIQAAYAERGVKAIAVQPWEVMGLSEADYTSQVNKTLEYGDQAWKEIGLFDAKYLRFFPDSVRQEFLPLPIRLDKYLKPFMDAHPQIQRVFYHGGGLSYSWDPYVGPDHIRKFVGNWMYASKAQLMNKSAMFPSAVWSMVEEHIVKPIAYVSEGTLRDPEGTDLHFVITPMQAQQWRAFSDLANNHLFLYPNSWQTESFEGHLRACSNVTGFYPCMTVYLSKRGRVTKVVGGGKTGEMFRYLLDNPTLKNAQFPEAPEPGYWYFSPDGFATNPKKVRDYPNLIDGAPILPNVAERERAGVMHFSFGSPAGFFGQYVTKEKVAAAKDKLEANIKEGKAPIIIKDTSATDFAVDPRDAEYALNNDIPIGHTAHMINYFLTIKYKLRDTGEWITIADKGMVEALQDPEVRALAAKYGDPDKITQYDWIPAIPGVNVPGNHDKDYAPDPWAYILKVWKQIKDGTYKYYLNDYQI
jgi:hypothetical protein